MIEKLTVYFIEARTGCTCCEYDNFVAGPFLTLDDARTQRDHYTRSQRLASQYAKNGVYYIYKLDGERLPDGRIIADNRVFALTNEEHWPAWSLGGEEY